MNDTKGKYLRDAKMKDSGVICSDLPLTVAKARSEAGRQTFGPGYWTYNGPGMAPDCEGKTLPLRS